MRIAAILVVALWSVSEAQAEERWALVLSGASGGPKYAEQMREWRTGISSALVDRYGFSADKVRMLVDETVKTGEQGTAANVRKMVGEIRQGLTRDDVLLIILLGHGTYDGDVAKFNLVGPDLTTKDWTDWLGGLPGRVAIVNRGPTTFDGRAVLKIDGGAGETLAALVRALT